jgi:hypothetical protein
MKKKILTGSLLLIGVFTSAFSETQDGEWRITYQNTTDEPLNLQVANNLPNHLICWITNSLKNSAIVTIPAKSSKEVTTVMNNSLGCSTAFVYHHWELKLHLWSSKIDKFITLVAPERGDIATTKDNSVEVSNTYAPNTIISSRRLDYFYPASIDSHIDSTVVIDNTDTFVDSISVHYPYGAKQPHQVKDLYTKN